MHGNASFDDLKDQLYHAIGLFPDVKYTERLNIHFARMGDPIFNTDVFLFARWLQEAKYKIQRDLDLRIEVIHPVLTTSLPKDFKKLEARLQEWCRIKNSGFHGQAGLQLSINSTNEKQRDEMFGNAQINLTELSRICDRLPEPLGRKYCLNFAYSTDFEIDAGKLILLFDPAKFMCKITPIHNNNACRTNNIKTVDGYSYYGPYTVPEAALKDAGFDVLVFIPSMDEEDGLVTCGNAILGGSTLRTETKESEIKIKGLNDETQISSVARPYSKKES